MNDTHKGAAERYLALSTHRQQYLDTAREASRLTLPFLYPPSGSSNHQILPQPYQSVGARGLNVMASKTIQTLMPASVPFFKFQVNDGELTSDPQIDSKIKTEVDEALSSMERIVMQEIDATQDRSAIFTSLLHLFVSGNVLIYLPDDATAKVFPLNHYVALRSGGEQLIELLTVEAVSRNLLPKEFRKKPDLQAGGAGAGSAGATGDVQMEENEVQVFTWVKYEKDMVKWQQWADDKPIPGTDGQSKVEESPWMALRFNREANADYGRGRIEEYLGDLTALDSLTASVLETSAGIAKTLWLVAPNAMVSADAVANAPNNAVLPGKEGDVTCIKADRGGDLQVPMTLMQQLEQRLNEAFLVFSPRQSERTTAEEIRAMQQELNEQLGGHLGNLTVDLLEPYLRRKMAVIRKKGILPKLPDDIMKPTIVTGLSGITRGQDVQAMLMAAQMQQQVLGPEGFIKYNHPEEFLKRLYTGVGLDAVGLVKTKEELQQEDQQLQQQQKDQQMTSQAASLAGVELEQQRLMMEAQQNGNQTQQAPTESTGQDGGDNPVPAGQG